MDSRIDFSTSKNRLLSDNGKNKDLNKGKMLCYSVFFCVVYGRQKVSQVLFRHLDRMCQRPVNKKEVLSQVDTAVVLSTFGVSKEIGGFRTSEFGDSR